MKITSLPFLVLVCSTSLLDARPGFHWHISLPDPLSDASFQHTGNENPDEVFLGKMLFYDKIISGNQNISCATCHHPFAATTDGLSLSVGEGGMGISTSRMNGIGDDSVHERVPRNAPAIFNLGAKEFKVMFHDGRVEEDPTQPSGFKSPAGNNLPLGLDSALAAQAMFPVTSATEMAGQAGENTVSDAAAVSDLSGENGVWKTLAGRLREIPEYVELFKAAYPDIQNKEDITFVHAANAIAAFESVVWRADDSPFDQYLKGDNEAISMRAFKGMMLFYGKAQCSSCHSGALQTDHQFHSIGMPQIGPGKGDGIDGHDDFGRERVTKDPLDRYKFRTPSLRNVALTGPWGHAGSYNTLEAVIQQHLDPVNSLNQYDPSQSILPSREDLDSIDYVVMDDDLRRGEIASSTSAMDVQLSETEIMQLVAFLHALTDYNSIEIREDVPASVPSGLVVFD